MATRASSTSVAISRMTPLAVPPRTAELPVVVGVNNFKTTIGAINDLNTKDTIGLPNVENLTPAQMPVSAAQAAALALKMDKTGNLPIGQVTDLQTALDSKLGRTENIPQSQVTDLTTRLDAIETNSIALSRIPEFEGGVQAIIDAQPAYEPSVVQGIHAW